MTLEQFETFISVLRYGSYLKASEELFVPQPTISHRIKHLEISLGKTLLVRGKGKIMLTEEGKSFVPYVEKALELIEEGKKAVHAIERMKEVDKWRLSIAGTLSITSAVLPVIISSFIDTYPHINIQVNSLPMEGFVQSLKSNVVNLGISSNELCERGLVCSLLHSEPVYLIVSKHHHLASKTSVNIETILKEPLILFPRGTTSRTNLDHILNQYKNNYDVKYETSNIEVIKSLIINNNSVSILPPFYLKHELTRNDLIKIKITRNPFPKQQIYMTTLEQTMNPSASLFITHIKKYMNMDFAIVSAL